VYYFKKLKTAFMVRNLIAAGILLALLFFSIPIEHKYDKLFRFYSLTLIPSGLELPRHFDKKIYFYFSDLAVLLLFGFGLYRQKLRLFEKGGIWLVLVFLFAIASIACSPLANYPIPYIRLLQIFTPFALFLFLSSDLIAKEKLFKIFSWSLFSSGLLQAALASYQYLSQKTLGLRMLGEQSFGANISVPGGRRWMLDNLTNVSNTPMSVFRAMGTLPHPNVLGGLLVLSLLMTAYFFQERRTWRLWLAPCYLLQLFALATTYSRSAIFAYLLDNLFWFVSMRIFDRNWMRGTALLIALSGLLIASLFSEQYLQRGGIVNYTALARASDQERLYYQDIALSMIKKHPLTGVGYGQFSLRSPSFGADPDHAIGAPHNTYLILATETGIFSLVAFICWIGMLLITALRSARKETMLLTGAFLAFLFIGLCDHYPLLTQQGKLLFFGAAGLLAAFCPAFSLQRSPKKITGY
jgi:hypothetical protein